MCGYVFETRTENEEKTCRNLLHFGRIGSKLQFTPNVKSRLSTLLRTISSPAPNLTRKSHRESIENRSSTEFSFPSTTNDRYFNSSWYIYHHEYRGIKIERKGRTERSILVGSKLNLEVGLSSLDGNLGSSRRNVVGEEDRLRTRGEESVGVL